MRFLVVTMLCATGLVVAPSARADDGPAAAPADALVPPRVTTFVHAQRPPGVDASAPVAVDLVLTINEDGAVASAEVTSSARAAFDEAALEAVRQFRFSPAQRGLQRIAVRIHYRYVFEPDPTPPGKETGNAAAVLGAPLAAAEFPPPEREARLEGKLVGRRDGRPLPGAVVTLRSVQGALNASTLTAENGAFTFSGVPSGTYLVRVDAEGFSVGQHDEALIELAEVAMRGATWVMWLLVALSVGALAVVLDRAVHLLRTHDDIRRLRRDLVTFLGREVVEGALARLATSRSPEARVARAGLSSPRDGAASAEERIAGAAQLAKLRMERRLAFLGTLGNNAPFIGLLGTVIGIIRAFHELNGSAGKVTAGLMAEVGEALVATAIGILVALPTIAAYNMFQRVIKTRLGRADVLGRDVMAYLKGERMVVISQTTTAFGDACRATLSESLWSPPLDRTGRAVSTFVSYTCRFEVR